MSSSLNDAITQMQQQLDTLVVQISQLQTAKPVDKDVDDFKDEQLTPHIAPMDYTPSEAEAEFYPPIRPSDPLSFFRTDLSDEKFWNDFRGVPKNTAMGYEPPKIPPIIQCSSSVKAQDTQLRNLQKRVAHLTRPVDLFIHQILSLQDNENLDEDTAELCTSFATFIRDHLAALAGRINAVRVENLKASHGIVHKHEEQPLVDPKQYQDEIKVNRALTEAFKPREFSGNQYRNSDNQRHPYRQAHWSKASREQHYRRHDDISGNGRGFRQDENKRYGNTQHRGRSKSRSSQYRKRKGSEEGSRSS